MHKRWPAMKRVLISGERLRLASSRKTRVAFLALLAVVLTLIAAVRPRWGEHTEVSYSETREVLIALDLSRSMWTEDVAPSRLEQAQQLAEHLLNGFKGESVGLIVFAGTAFVQVPLSPDYQIIREFLPSLDPDYMPQGGSDYSRLLDAALEGFSEKTDRDRYLIVLSDGESSAPGWEQRLEQLSQRGIHVLSIGLGTDKGGFISDQQGGYWVDRKGDAVHSKLMPATLQALAHRTNGRYIDASTLKTAEDVRALIADTVETGRKGPVRNEANTVRTERFQWFLLPAVLLGLLSLLLEFPRWPKPRRVRRHSALAAAVTLSLTFGLSTTVRAHFDSEAEFDVREVLDSNPVQRLRAITEHLSQYGYDAFDLRLMVEETLKYGVDAQRTGLQPTQGVIRDAIEACRQGKTLNASIADWSYYQAQLTAMLSPAADANESTATKRKELMDEEDTPPSVTGDSTQQSASDSFGQGAATQTDAVLGELSPDHPVTSPSQRKSSPPKRVRTAGVTGSKSSGVGGEDPILELSKQRLDDAVRNDSPARVHQLLAGSNEPQSSDQPDW